MPKYNDFDLDLQKTNNPQITSSYSELPRKSQPHACFEPLPTVKKDW